MTIFPLEKFKLYQCSFCADFTAILADRLPTGVDRLPQSGNISDFRGVLGPVFPELDDLSFLSITESENVVVFLFSFSLIALTLVNRMMTKNPMRPVQKYRKGVLFCQYLFYEMIVIYYVPLHDDKHTKTNTVSCRSSMAVISDGFCIEKFSIFF